MPTWRLTKSESFAELPREDALELASQHNGHRHSPVEREVRLDRVKRLVVIIREGKALPFNWATVFYDGYLVRMNGQHSSAAIVEVGADLPDGLSFHMDRYEADDRNGMVDLFRQFDQKWSSRSSADICGAFQGLVPELTDCNKALTMKAAQGISWCLKTIVGSADVPDGDNAYALLHSERFVPFVRWVNSMWNGRKELMHKVVLAAMLQTYESSQSGATKFWREVSFGPDYFTDDMLPGAVLIGELSHALEDKEYRSKEFETEGHYYKKAVKAWNAFCAGQRINSLKVTKTKGWPEVSDYSGEGEAA